VVTEEAVYTFFGNSGVFALDHEGNQLWHQDVGETVHYWGSGSSPIVYKNVLIVNASVESEALYGLDRKTGEVLWKQDGVIESWVTPVILTANGRDELVISQKEKVRAFDPVSGKQLWHARGIRDYVCPSPVAHDGVVYIIGGRRGNGMAIRGGGSGDVTRSHIVWTIRVGANTPSPALYDGHLYWVGDAGRLAYCVDIETGKVVYRERVDPRAGTVYSSMTAAGGRLYVPNRAGDTYVFAARPDYELITINKLETDVEEEQSAFNASPVPLGDRLLLRSDAALYCIGK
jgi:hypothetical protein